MEGKDHNEIDMDPDVMLRRLGARAAPWYDMADLLNTLNRKGYDSNIIEEMADIPRPVQSMWVVASNVYRSFADSPELSASDLAYFEPADRAECLIDLRNVLVVRRAAAAKYIAENQLDTQDSAVLARSIKEHERKRSGYQSFSEDPGDCLAFKYWRDAQETKNPDQIAKFVKLGTACAVSDSARAALKGLLGQSDDEIGDGSGDHVLTTYDAVLPMPPLTADETSFRMLPVAGELSQVSPDDILAAPKAVTEGIFQMFVVPQGGVGVKWLPAPMWTVIQKLKSPVAVTVKDCAEYPEILYTNAVKNRTEATKVRGGLGMLIVEREPPGGIPTPTGAQFFLVSNAQGHVGIRNGGHVTADDRVLGLIVTGLRPFTPDMANTGKSLMSGINL